MISLSIIGNLGGDAVVKEVGNKKVIEFSVCHSAKKTDGTQITTWVKCSKWGETTAVAPYLLKGTKVFVEGLPTSEAWLKDGAAMSSIKLMVNKIELLGKSEQVQETTDQNKGFADTVELPEGAEKLPF